ncbi:hypothetical protein [Thauera linaloolentis]|nr:hypothetical protein [Thauera linaloolentis]MCM8566996.1 hypothetical protein [Thauera linaloolentis]
MRKPALPSSLARALLVALLALTAGCDMLSELLDLPNPAREHAMKEAEGRAVGSACRHAGRSLEDCYALNPASEKASVFAGWRDMNDYMMEHKLDVVPSRLVPNTLQPAADAAPAAADGAGGDAGARQ